MAIMAMGLSQHALAQPVFVAQIAQLCSDEATARAPVSAAPPSGSSAVPGSQFVTPVSPSNIANTKCFWIAANTSLVITGRYGDVSEVRMTGQPYPFYIKSAALTPGVGGTPTPSLHPDQDLLNIRMKYLRNKLAITSVQELVFSRYIDNLRKNLDAREALESEFLHQLPSMNSVIAMTMRQKMARLEAKQEMLGLPLFVDLYNALSPGQKSAADTIFVPHRN